MSDYRLLRLVHAWNIYNMFISENSSLNIGTFNMRNVYHKQQLDNAYTLHSIFSAHCEL